MEWIYKPFSYTAVIVAVGFLIKYLIQKKIDSYFNKKLEDHKKELAVMTEKAKYDISRKLFDFEAYAIKKHTIYPELYQLLFEVGQQLNGLTVRMEHISKIEELDEKERVSFTEGKELHAKITDASDYFRKNELFLSKGVASICGETVDEIRKLQKYIYYKRDNIISFVCENIDKINQDRDKIFIKIYSLKEAIYEELSYSHFEKTEEKV